MSTRVSVSSCQCGAMVAQQFCKLWVAGSSPVTGSIKNQAGCMKRPAFFLIGLKRSPACSWAGKAARRDRWRKRSASRPVRSGEVGRCPSTASDSQLMTWRAIDESGCGAGYSQRAPCVPDCRRSRAVIDNAALNRLDAPSAPNGEGLRERACYEADRPLAHGCIASQHRRETSALWKRVRMRRTRSSAAAVCDPAFLKKRLNIA